MCQQCHKDVAEIAKRVREAGGATAYLFGVQDRNLVEAPEEGELFAVAGWQGSPSMTLPLEVLNVEYSQKVIDIMVHMQEVVLVKNGWMKDESICLGVWLKDGQVRFDYVELFTDRETALMVADLQNQEAVYDFKAGADIRVS